MSMSGTVFLVAHGYLDHYKTDVNLVETLLKTIQEIGSYNVIQVITDNVANCKVVGVIIEDVYHSIFCFGWLVHTLNLLMHDIIRLKEHDYKWIDALYKKGKRMVKFITNHSPAHFIFSNHSKFDLLKLLQRPSMLAIISL
jgi:hypothetical protein